MKQPICKNCRFAVWTKHPSGRIDGHAPGRCTHPVFFLVDELNAGPFPMCIETPNRPTPIVFACYGNPESIFRESIKPCSVFEPIRKVKQ